MQYKGRSDLPGSMLHSGKNPRQQQVKERKAIQAIKILLAVSDEGWKPVHALPQIDVVTTCRLPPIWKFASLKMFYSNTISDSWNPTAILIYIMVLFLFNNIIYVFLLLWLCILIVCLCMATLTEVFPCFFLSCKANARVKPAKTGHGPHSSEFLCCSMYCLFCVVLCIVCVYMCTVLLPPGGYPIAVNIYHIYIYIYIVIFIWNLRRS